jgi:hypothetical protein
MPFVTVCGKMAKEEKIVCIFGQHWISCFSIYDYELKIYWYATSFFVFTTENLKLVGQSLICIFVFCYVIN